MRHIITATILVGVLVLSLSMVISDWKRVSMVGTLSGQWVGELRKRDIRFIESLEWEVVIHPVSEFNSLDYYQYLEGIPGRFNYHPSVIPFSSALSLVLTPNDKDFPYFDPGEQLARDPNAAYVVTCELVGLKWKWSWIRRKLRL